MRLSMNSRFKLSTIVAISFVFFFGSFSAYKFHTMNSIIQKEISSDVNVCKLIENDGFHIDLLQSSFLAESSAPIFKGYNKSLTQLNRLRRMFKEQFVKDTYLKKSSKVILENIRKIATNLKALPTNNEVKTNEVLQILINFQHFRKLILSIRSDKLTILSSKQNKIAQISQTYQNEMAFVSVVTIIFALLILLFMSHQIKLPMRRIKTIIHSIQDGNYVFNARNYSNDEVGQLITSLSAMVEHIKTRETMRIEKIQIEKKRFSAMANYVKVPLLLINEENQIAFANIEFLEMFRLVWDDIYEVNFDVAPLPQEFKEIIIESKKEKKWLKNEPLDIIGQNYAFELKVSLLPVKSEKNDIISTICLLGELSGTKTADTSN